MNALLRRRLRRVPEQIEEGPSRGHFFGGVLELKPGAGHIITGRLFAAIALNGFITIFRTTHPSNTHQQSCQIESRSGSAAHQIFGQRGIINAYHYNVATLTHAHSFCGSVRWSISGFSPERSNEVAAEVEPWFALCSEERPAGVIIMILCEKAAPEFRNSVHFTPRGKGGPLTSIRAANSRPLGGHEERNQLTNQ